jgi:elongation factor G
MGELHLDIIVDRLRREFDVDVNQGAPQVAYKESITQSVDHKEVYKKQSGGRGKFADIRFELCPVDDDYEGEGLQFLNEIKGGNIPKEFIPSVEKGFTMAMANGVLAGYPLNSLKVRLYDGSYHDVDSDALSFEICSQIAFKSAAKQAGPKILEPIMKLTVITPEENMGDVIGDLNRRRGQVEGMDDKSGAKVVNAKVPLSEMFGYITDLRTITSGRATSTMEFFNFVEAPRNISDEVIKKIKGE